jgi:acetylornithine/succinyldiaminopimelate/putrescine aminotransferase
MQNVHRRQRSRQLDCRFERRGVVKHQSRLLRHVNEVSDYFCRRLSGMDFGSDAEICIKGRAVAVAFKKEGAAGHLRDKCRWKGLLVNAESDDLMMLPALNLDLRTARKGLDILESCL